MNRKSQENAPQNRCFFCEIRHLKSEKTQGKSTASKFFTVNYPADSISANCDFTTALRLPEPPYSLLRYQLRSQLFIKFKYVIILTNENNLYIDVCYIFNIHSTLRKQEQLDETFTMDANFEYVFPTIRGVQAGCEHYVSMCPLRLIPRMFLFNEAELVPELRAQRQLNRARLPEIARYIAENPNDYVFSAITASVDATVRFQPVGNDDQESRMGTLHIPMDARFIINDGQHRRAAIDLALQESPDLADESIAVVFFVDKGLKRCQQMFADLNKYAIRPSRSLGILYDHRDDRAELARLIVTRSPFFQDMVEMEKTNLSQRSRRLITLSALYTATAALFYDTELAPGDERADRAIEYWTAVGEQFKEWSLVHKNDLKASEVRQDYIHSHGVVLHALGRVGCTLFKHAPKEWRKRLVRLKSIDWKRTNTALWEGRAMVGGRVSKNQLHVTLTTNTIKAALDLPLTKDEQVAEAEFTGATNG